MREGAYDATFGNRPAHLAEANRDGAVAVVLDDAVDRRFTPDGRRRRARGRRMREVRVNSPSFELQCR